MNKKVFIFTLCLISITGYYDYGISNHAVSNYPSLIMEGNPFTKGIVNKPYLAMPIIQITNGGFSHAMSGIYDDNKTLAWIITGAIFIVKGYVVYHNLKVLGKVK